MSLLITTDISCNGTREDGERCAQWTNGVAGGNIQASNARRQAYRDGWRTLRFSTRFVDYCPDCWERVCQEHPEYSQGYMRYPERADPPGTTRVNVFSIQVKGGVLPKLPL